MNDEDFNKQLRRVVMDSVVHYYMTKAIGASFHYILDYAIDAFQLGSFFFNRAKEYQFFKTEVWHMICVLIKENILIKAGDEYYKTSLSMFWRIYNEHATPKGMYYEPRTSK